MYLKVPAIRNGWMGGFAMQYSHLQVRHVNVNVVENVYYGKHLNKVIEKQMSEMADDK